ncbi:MAG: hypothetical protein NTX47_04705 [Candidatus Omnitrophica bacterium]|nr:hypothetical protein [Candidatus Omnitrophota bacterium]
MRKNIPNSAGIKMISLFMAQVFLFTSLAYPEAVYSLRNAMIFSKTEETAGERTNEIAALAANQNLNKYFKVLAGEDARMAVEDFIRKDKDPEKVWVICGDMSSIRLMNTVYHPEILDILIPMTVNILSDFLAGNKYEGIAVRVGIRGDEIQIALSSKYSKEDIDRIRKKAQEEVAKSITGIFWVCKVGLFEGGQLFDAASTGYSAISRYAEIRDSAHSVLGDDLLTGLYKDQDGIFLVFMRNPGEKLEESIDKNLKRLNEESGLEGLEIKIDSNVRPFGLLSPRILFGAAQLGQDLEKASERAERILNVAKDFGIEGATDGLLSEEVRSYVDLERQTVFETPEEERKRAAGIMNVEEISGVKVHPEHFDPFYLALGEKHLRPLLEDAMTLALTQGLIRAKMQPVLVGLLDVRYVPKGKFWEALVEAYPEQEDRIKKFRGQIDNIFGETVAFKYFNDAVKNMGLEKEGHGLGNEVLKAEAKAIIEEVLVKLDRHNILLFRGPPDNWWFVFLNPMGQEYSGDQKNMAEFVDKISESFNRALENLGLDVEVRLRMNVASSTDVGIAPFSIVNTVRHVAKSRMMERTRSFKTNGGNIVKIYDPKKHGDLSEELSDVRAEERLKAQDLLAENIVKAVKLREKENAVTQNDIAAMRTLEENGWLKQEGLEMYERLASKRGVEPKEALDSRNSDLLRAYAAAGSAL